MEQKVMGAFTAIILAVVITMSCILIYVPNMHIIALRIEDSKLSGGRVSVMDMLRASDLELKGEGEETRETILKGHQIRLTLPQNVTSASVNIDNIHVEKTIKITINGIGKDYFENYPMRGESNNIIDITYDSENLVGVIELTLDTVMEAKLTSEQKYYLLKCADPRCFIHIFWKEDGDWNRTISGEMQFFYEAFDRLSREQIMNPSPVTQPFSGIPAI